MTCIFLLDCMTFRLLVAWYQSGYPGQCGATWWPTKFKLDSIPECYFICDLFDNIAPFKYLGETCYVEFTRRCPTEVARGAKRWETRQICFLPSLWYVWQNTSFTNTEISLRNLPVCYEKHCRRCQLPNSPGFVLTYWNFVEILSLLLKSES